MSNLSATLTNIKNIKIAPYTYTVEKGKIKEFASAIGDEKEEYMNGETIPPTFPTVIEFWGGKSSSSETLGLNMSKVLHGEQAFEYLGDINPGDEITVNSTVEDVYTKASMNFVVLKKEFVNQNNETVLISRSTIIERH